MQRSRVEDFQLVAWFLSFAAFVVFDDDGDIAAAEIFLRQVFGKRDAAEHFVFHSKFMPPPDRAAGH